MTDSETDVSVIGCGNMGSAFICTLADAGREVTIWNRTRAKAEALAGPQVTVADSVEHALEASPTTLVSVTNYEATREVLDDHLERLAGRTLVQLSSGKPDAARSLDTSVTRADGDYVDGVVFSYPSAVGTDDLLIIYSGDPEAFEATRPLLEQLGGTAMHVGDDPGAACVYDFATVPPAMIMAIGIWQGAKICEVEGVSLEIFEELTEGLIPVIAKDSLRKAADPDFATDPEKAESTVRAAVEEAETLAEYFHEVGIDTGIVSAVHRLLQAGVENGRGEHDIACVAELHADHPEPIPQTN